MVDYKDAFIVAEKQHITEFVPLVSISMTLNVIFHEWCERWLALQLGCS
jgi:hypothetical protein